MNREKKYTGIITISGKNYKAEVINGESFVDGKPYQDFLKTLSFDEILQLALVGKAIIEDEKITREMKGKRKAHERYKKRSPQKTMDEFHQAKNN